MADKQQAGNAAINAWIRGRHRTPQAPAQPDPAAPPSIPPGNAGAGTGAPPPQAPPRSMNDFIRRVVFNSDQRTFTIGGR